MIFGDLVKQKIPVVGILCGGSKLIEEKQNFVVCFTLRSLFSPHICSNDARLNSWCVRKPLLLLTAPFAVAPDESTARRRMADLLHNTVSSQRLKNTNSHYLR